MENMLTSFFDPSSYSGQQGGLLDLLRQAAAQNAQYQPSQGFVPPTTPAVAAGAPAQPAPAVAADDDEGEPASPASPAQASPIGIGGYQMPRFGSAQDFTPPPNALPQNAQPAQGQLPPIPAAPASPNIFGHIGAALQSIGAPNSLFHNVVTNPLTALVTGQTPQSQAQQQQAQIANVTAKALLAKGVDPQAVLAAIQPGNGEMLKTLVTQAYGPQTVQSLGSGYIADKNGKITRAYEPEDKIPAGFVKGDDGNMHFIPGGPADPAYIQLAEAKKKDPNGVYTLGRGGELYKVDAQGNPTIVHKNEAEAPVPMDPASLEILARREIGGDFSGRKNLGRGQQGAADLKAITNKSAEILTNEMGMTPTEAAAHLLKKQQEFNAQGQGLNAEARTTGVREANLNLILRAADAAIPAALEASDKVARTGWVPLNKVIQGGEVIASDPDLKKFGMANLQLAEHWARAMNPTGVMRESDRDKALSFLSTADSKETYKAAVGQLRTQIERERDAVKSTRGMSDLPGSTAPTPGAPALGIGQSSTINGVSIKRVN